MIQNCLEIANNSYGNYAIQHIFEEWGFKVCSELLKVIDHNIVTLSIQKFSSNVVEKCLDISDEV